MKLATNRHLVGGAVTSFSIGLMTLSLIEHSKKLIIIILAITFVQCTYNDIPETNHVPTVHSVAAALYLQFMVQHLHVMLFPMLTFRRLMSTIVALTHR
jgi:hypothetical protein